MLHVAVSIPVIAFQIFLLHPSAAVAQVDLNCDYYNFQEQAQASLDEDPTDPHFLDEDSDGIACPNLPEAGPTPVFPELPGNGDYRCVDFPYQEMAQEVYNENLGDPYNLDPTRDGIACSRLPFLSDYQDTDDLSVDDAAEDMVNPDVDASVEDLASEGNAPVESDRCESVATSVVEGIATGILPETGASLRGARAVRSEDFEQVWFVAADLEGPGLDGLDQIGLWATNEIDPAGASLILAVDGFAKEFTDWPDGGQTDAELGISDDGAEEAKECVRANLE